jgi:hypothetical protein
MPISTRFSSDGKGILRIFEGTVTASDILGSLNLILSDERIRTATYSLIDFTAAIDISASDGDWRQIAWVSLMLSDLNPDLCVAVVAPSERVLELILHWQSSAKPTPWRIAVFRSMDEAHLWLGASVAGYEPES